MRYASASVSLLLYAIFSFFGGIALLRRRFRFKFLRISDWRDLSTRNLSTPPPRILRQHVRVCLSHSWTLLKPSGFRCYLARSIHSCGLVTLMRGGGSLIDKERGNFAVEPSGGWTLSQKHTVANCCCYLSNVSQEVEWTCDSDFASYQTIYFGALLYQLASSTVTDTVCNKSEIKNVRLIKTQRSGVRDFWQLQKVS